jgi:phytanoyl-CoA hydroxylase
MIGTTMLETQEITAVMTAFESDGFTAIRNFLSEPETVKLIGEVDRYMKEIAPDLPEEDALYEDKDNPETLFRLERMHKHAPYFDQLPSWERLVSLASALLDDEAVPQGSELLAKAPRVGAQTPPHQDGYYFLLEPNEALTFWLPIDPADEENGCLRFLPGSHRRGMRCHEFGHVLGFSQGIVDYGPQDYADEVAVCAAPGDVLVHHSMTVHRADPNPTPRLRRAIGLGYYAKRAKIDIEARDARARQIYDHWRESGRL